MIFSNTFGLEKWLFNDSKLSILKAKFQFFFIVKNYYAKIVGRIKMVISENYLAVEKCKTQSKMYITYLINKQQSQF